MDAEYLIYILQRLEKDQRGPFTEEEDRAVARYLKLPYVVVLSRHAAAWRRLVKQTQRERAQQTEAQS